LNLWDHYHSEQHKWKTTRTYRTQDKRSRNQESGKEKGRFFFPVSGSVLQIQ
jgi:hypothetical protein